MCISNGSIKILHTSTKIILFLHESRFVWMSFMVCTWYMIHEFFFLLLILWLNISGGIHIYIYFKPLFSMFFYFILVYLNFARLCLLVVFFDGISLYVQFENLYMYIYIYIYMYLIVVGKILASWRSLVNLFNIPFDIASLKTGECPGNFCTFLNYIGLPYIWKSVIVHRLIFLQGTSKI